MGPPAGGAARAEAVRRARRDLRPAEPRAVLIGRYECDFAPVEAEALVQEVYAPSGSELDAACARAGVPAQPFLGWEELARELL